MQLLMVTRRPRAAGGEISAMYIGAVMLAIPIATPTTERPTRRTGKFPARPSATDPATKMAPDATIVFLRPKNSLQRPPASAPTMAKAMVTLTASSSSQLWSPHSSWMISIAPDTTPVSYPKRKPPIAESAVAAKR